MKGLISKQVFKEECLKAGFFPAQIVAVLKRTPAVDAVEVKHRFWDDSGRYKFPSGAVAVRCSECGCALHESEYRLYNWHYCPCCGAKMDGERKENENN